MSDTIKIIPEEGLTEHLSLKCDPTLKARIEEGYQRFLETGASSTFSGFIRSLIRCGIDALWLSIDAIDADGVERIALQKGVLQNPAPITVESVNKSF